MKKIGRGGSKEETKTERKVAEVAGERRLRR